MEPPAKRPRKGPSPLAQSQNDEYDELNYDPEDVSQMRDPGIQLETSRAFAAHRLKSTFEHIFEKYEKDFTGIGDEIDLATGKLLTNNGHLENMRHEMDTGVPGEEDEDEGMLLEEAFGSQDDDQERNRRSDQSDEEDEERILHGKKNGGSDSTTLVRRASMEIQRRPSLVTLGRPGSSSSNPSADIWGSRPQTLDPTWEAPEIESKTLSETIMSNLRDARYRFPISSRSVWSSRPDDEQDKMIMKPPRIDMATFSRARQEYIRPARPPSMKLLRAFTVEGDDNEDDEDDILGVSMTERPPQTQEKEKEPISDDNVAADGAREQPLPSVEDLYTHEVLAKSSSEKPSESNPEEHDSTEKRPNNKRRPGRPKKTPVTPVESQNETESGPNEDTSIGIDPASSLSSLVTEGETQTISQHRVVVELVMKSPPPGTITEFEEPEDADTYGIKKEDNPVTEDLSHASAPLSTQEASDSGPIAAPVEGTTITTGEAPEKTSTPPKEIFTRYQNDNDFSDAEEAMPKERAIPRKRRAAAKRGNEPAAPAPAPVNVEPPSPAPDVFMETAELPVVRVEQEDDDWILAPPAAQVEPSSENIDTMEVDVEEATEAEEASDRPARPHDNLPQENNENPSTLERQSVVEPEEQQSLEDLLVAEALDLMAGIPSSSPSKPMAIPPNSPPPDIAEQEADRGFDVIILDDVDDAELSESGPEPEAEQQQQQQQEPGLEPEPEPQLDPEPMDVELPTLPKPSEPDAAPQTPPRRPKRTHFQDQKGATSPMGHLNLDSSSPSTSRAQKVRRRRESIKSKSPTSTTQHRASPDPSVQQRPEVAAFPEHRPAAPVSKPNEPPATSTSQKPTPRQHTSKPKSSRKRKSQETATDAPAESTPAESTPREQKNTPRPQKTPRQRKPAKTPSRSFASLISDDEDELTLDLFKSWTNNTERPSSSGRKTTAYAPVLLAGPQTKVTTPMKQRSHNAGGGGSGTATTTTTGKSKKRKLAWAFAATPTKKTQVGSPSGSLVRTPGGNMRRCGEEGFKCDRDFCFACL